MEKMMKYYSHLLVKSENSCNYLYLTMIKINRNYVDKTKISCLLKPLETLAKADETVVRLKAIESLTYIANRMDHNTILNTFLLLVNYLINYPSYINRFFVLQILISFKLEYQRFL